MASDPMGVCIVNLLASVRFDAKGSQHGKSLAANSTAPVTALVSGKLLKVRAQAPYMPLSRRGLSRESVHSPHTRPSCGIVLLASKHDPRWPGALDAVR